MEWFLLRSRIGLATREFGTRRTLVSSRRKQTCTPLKQPWTLPMCRHRPARQTLQQHPTQVKCTAALPSSLADSKTTLSLSQSHSCISSDYFLTLHLSFSLFVFLSSSLFLSDHQKIFLCFPVIQMILVCWYLHYAVCTCWEYKIKMLFFWLALL